MVLSDDFFHFKSSRIWVLGCSLRGIFFGFGTLSEQHILHKGPPGSAVGPGGQNIDLDVVGLEARGLSSFFMD